jgi:hypothetical protein
MNKFILKISLIVLSLFAIGISILWARGAFHTFTSRLNDAPSSNAVQQPTVGRSGKIIIRHKTFEFGKDWNADFEIINDTSQPMFYVGSKDRHRFAYCTLAAKHKEQYQNISFKIRYSCYESTFLALQSLQPGERLILAVEKQDVRDLLHLTNANSEIKAQIGFEVFVGEGKRREILWSDEVTFPRSDGL